MNQVVSCETFGVNLPYCSYGYDVKWYGLAIAYGTSEADRKKMSSRRMDDDISKPMMQEDVDMVVEGWVDYSGKNVEAETHKQEAQNQETPKSKRVDSAAVLLDLARLKEISRGDAEFQNELLEIFMEDALEHLAEVKLAFQTKDYLTLARRAHQLKGASATVAIQHLPDLAAQLERQAIEHQLTDASELIAKLEQILERLQTFISDNYIG